jgi:hypothetical protein
MERCVLSADQLIMQFAVPPDNALLAVGAALPPHAPVSCLVLVRCASLGAASTRLSGIRQLCIVSGSKLRMDGLRMPALQELHILATTPGNTLRLSLKRAHLPSLRQLHVAGVTGGARLEDAMLRTLRQLSMQGVSMGMLLASLGRHMRSLQPVGGVRVLALPQAGASRGRRRLELGGHGTLKLTAARLGDLQHVTLAWHSSVPDSGMAAPFS